jgi:hypothetical protein
MGPSSGHGPSDGEIIPTVGGHAHSLSMGFPSEVGTMTAGPVGMLMFMRSVSRFIGGQDLSLLPAVGNASLLLTSMAGARSFHKGHLEAAMRLHHRV